MLAKEALSKPVSIREMVASDLKSKVFKLIKEKHQQIFDKEKNNKLYNIFPKIASSITNIHSFDQSFTHPCIILNAVILYIHEIY